VADGLEHDLKWLGAPEGVEYEEMLEAA